MQIGPTTRDWLLFIGSAVFTAVGLVIIALTGKSSGYAAAGFFGGCTALHGWMLFVKIGAEKETSILSTEASGPTRLQSKPIQFVALALGLCVLGITLGMTGSETSVTIGWVSWSIAAIGISMLAWFFTGRLVTPFIEFEARGIKFVQKDYSFLLTWDNITSVKPGKAVHHPALFLKIQDLEPLLKSGTYSKRFTQESNPLKDMLGANQSYYKTDLVIFPFQYGTNIVVLSNALKMYIEDPSLRPKLNEPA